MSNLSRGDGPCWAASAAASQASVKLARQDRRPPTRAVRPGRAGSATVRLPVIGDQVAVDDVGQVPLEAAAGLLGRLGLGDLALVVRLFGTGVADLADRSGAGPC